MKEIEDLKAEKEKAAELEREEAEKVAQAKLAQIEKLKQEHEAKTKLFNDKLEFENLQNKD